jgi:hypothetical protein
MGQWENLSILLAVLLAVIVAVLSSAPRVAQEIVSYSAEALKPQTADLGADPGYLLGTASDGRWLPSPKPDTTVAKRHQAPTTSATR